jgi:glycosyltransferase involved in cell wall biosynthesis
VSQVRVSVIVPTFNRAADVARCLDALERQTFKDFEVLVCDDGSTDDTAEVVSRYENRLNVRYHWAENFGGPARPRNAGVRLARGEYVAFLDADDWWMPEKLERSLCHLERGADFVYHDLYFVPRTGQARFRRKSPTAALETPAFDSLLRAGNVINNSSVVVRRALMENIGGFSEERNLIAGEDYEAWLRVARLTDRFERIPDALGYYWVGSGNISNPTRTVRILAELEKLYAADIARVGRMQWIGYTRARCNYLLGNLAEARDQLASIDWTGAPLAIHARGVLLKTLLTWRRAA